MELYGCILECTRSFCDFAMIQHIVGSWVTRRSTVRSTIEKEVKKKCLVIDLKEYEERIEGKKKVIETYDQLDIYEDYSQLRQGNNIYNFAHKIKYFQELIKEGKQMIAKKNKKIKSMVFNPLCYYLCRTTMSLKCQP